MQESNEQARREVEKTAQREQEKGRERAVAAELRARKLTQDTERLEAELKRAREDAETKAR